MIDQLKGMERVTAALAEIGVRVRLDTTGRCWITDPFGFDPRLCYKAELVAAKKTEADYPLEQWAQGQIDRSEKPGLWRRWLRDYGIEVA